MTALERFLASLNEPPDPRSLAWDVGAVEGMSGPDRASAEDALMARATRGDVRAIKSLALLRVTRAEPALRTLIQSGAGPARHAAARALGLITGDQAVIASLVQAQGGRVDAFTAWDLKSMPGHEAFLGLVAALTSSDLPARMHALDGLAQRTNVTALRQPRGAPLNRYELLLGSHLATLYQPAGSALQDLFTQLEAGASAETLGLDYAASADATLVEQYWRSAGRTGKPYADALLAPMSEHDREWALALVVARVENEDPRSLDTIEAQVLRWARPVLEEMVTRPPRKPEFLAAVLALIPKL